VRCFDVTVWAGEAFPLEKALEAVQASLKVGRGGKVLLEG
jgi:hypothetical protein